MIKFTQIPARAYPPSKRAQISTIQSEIITNVSATYDGRFLTRKKIIDVLNEVAYLIITGDSFPAGWTADSDISSLPISDSSEVKSVLGGLYLVEKNVDWDIDAIDSKSEIISESTVVSQPVSEPTIQLTQSETITLTPKEDLYLQPPMVPRFLTTPWISERSGADTLVIYPSEPKIPTKQNEISVTTNVEDMTDFDLLKLYPHQFIQTRPAVMYKPVDGLGYHMELGVILPIASYNTQELIDNLIKYPHIYKLQRLVDGEFKVFYTSIEINGELKDVADVWGSSLLEDTSVIPYTADFVKEYVVRRYLLERDHGIVHNYPLYGELDPFLTLIAPASKYAEWGYLDSVGVARSCVTSRIRYKRSRNPILRRLNNE